MTYIIKLIIMILFENTIILFEHRQTCTEMIENINLLSQKDFYYK